MNTSPASSMTSRPRTSAGCTGRKYEKRLADPEKYFSSERRRPLTPPSTINSYDDHMSWRTADQSNCRLLCLPAELRAPIWDYAMPELFIGIYRKLGGLSHCIMDQSNTQSAGDLVVLSPETMQKAVVDIYNASSRDSWSHPPPLKRGQLNALSQTCRSM